MKVHLFSNLSRGIEDEIGYDIYVNFLKIQILFLHRNIYNIHFSIAVTIFSPEGRLFQVDKVFKRLKKECRCGYNGYIRKASAKNMMDELKDVKRTLNPTEVLLVVDAMTGQEAAASVTTFNLEIGIIGAILTKLDGDSRGGAALSVKEVSGKPIKLDLGHGRCSLICGESIEVMKQEVAEDLQKKIMSAKFDFNDFLKQTRVVARMGSMSRVLGMIPGMGKVTPAQIREAERAYK
ncbi:unnamed protein product [Lactuca virosa]|uniref:SRP54-type proteins GTP-binding domain-containing protein n=1 Tax=Lactuca virosa TaxID=75947 RepID=A0AAU9MQJ2_9ASTR|nr:unnamed protein product [Lactuca virosa]